MSFLGVRIRTALALTGILLIGGPATPRDGFAEDTLADSAIADSTRADSTRADSILGDDASAPILRLDEDPRVLAALDSLAALFHTDRHRLGVDEAALESAGSVPGELSLHRYLMREPLRAPGVVTTAAARLDPKADGRPMLIRSLDLLIEIGDYPSVAFAPRPDPGGGDSPPEDAPTLLAAMDALFAGTGERFHGRDRETFIRETATLPPVLLDHLPRMFLDLRAAVDARNAVLDASDFGRGGLFGSATRHTRDLLMGALLGVSVEGRDGAEGPPPEIPEGALESVRLDRLVAAGHRLAAVLDAEASQLVSDPRLGDTGRFKHTWFTPYGRIAVGGVGNDEYRGDYLLVVDLGGNDAYERAGGVTAGEGGVAALIDVAGDDHYGPADSARVAPGGAVLGIAGVWDLGGGADVYESAACGSGFAFLGMAWVRDDGGDDRHHHGMLAQGSAGYGVGLLLDEGGEDVYDLSNYESQGSLPGRGCGQGYGGSAGLGVLIEVAGNDSYRAIPRWAGGGARLGHPAEFPLAQGAGAALMGTWHPQDRNTRGGTGWLLDLAGNDLYTVEVGQGYGEEGGLGVQLDVEGEDRYISLSGAGIGTYRGLGIHLDLAGNDSTAAVVGQGLGWELGQGLFVNAAGDDSYHWATLGGGVALSDGAGWFLDLGGADIYKAAFAETEFNTWPPTPGWYRGTSPSLLTAPGTGIFIDLEAPHHFPAEKWSGIPEGSTGAFRRGKLPPARPERYGIFFAPGP